jgi:alcohol dehydrogenase class IV
MEAIKLVYNQIPVAYADGSNMKAREDMHNASTLAGMAFTNSSLGIVHSLAHKIGGEFGVTHGLANAILLPYIVEYNKKGTDKFAEIEKQLGVNDLVETLKELNLKVGIPTSFKEITEVELTEDKFNEVLDRMSKNAFEDPCSLTNPRVPTVEDVKEIYKAAFYGTTAKNI